MWSERAAELPLADGMGSSAPLSASALSGYMITSSHYRTRRELFSLGQRPSSDTPSADRVYLVWKNLIRCVIPPSSDLRGDGTNGSSVLVLFVLVRPPLFYGGTSGTTSNTEQVLASMAPTVAIRG